MRRPPHMRTLLLPLLLLGRAAAFSSSSLLPTFSSGARTCASSRASGLCMAANPDLLVVGAGTLGKLLIEDFKKKFPDSRVVAETRTEAKHEDLRALGAVPRTKDAPLDFETAKHVVFCAAPGGNDDYTGEIKRAVGLWGGKNQGRMVFTSSAGVYAEQDGGMVDESSPVQDTPRNNKLVDGENLVLAAGGTVLRLAGLYSLDRGAHSYWIKTGKCEGFKDGLVGLVSYADSAKAVMCALTCERNVAGEVFVVCDAAKQTRVDIITSALKTQMWRKYAFPTMTDSGPSEHAKGVGKTYNTAKIKTTGWQPTFKDFDAFCEAHK